MIFLLEIANYGCVRTLFMEIILSHRLDNLAVARQAELLQPPTSDFG